MAVTETTLSKALITLRKRRGVVIVCVLLSLLHGLYKAETQPHIFDAFGRIILMALAFGVLAGIVAAVLMRSLRTGLRSVAEVEAITELPSLAVIPRARPVATPFADTSVASRSIGSLALPKSQFAEAFRSLHTAVMLSTGGHPPKRILFTSATPSEGKTTAASNLACILAQGDPRVLLIDADLRRPTIHYRFGLNGRAGLTSVLTGATTFDNALQKIPGVPNLDILLSGPVPPFQTEMLSSEPMNALLAHCDQVYTHIILDSPPILSATDGVGLAKDTDAVILVVRHGKSRKHTVRRARDLLLRSGAPVSGIVLNAVDLNSPEYCGYPGGQVGNP
jgi:succinoglycan biosynthesis transport protein ExoP